MRDYMAIRPRSQVSSEMAHIVDEVSVCYQCGTCSSSCPVGPAGGMDYTPRRIMRLIQAGAEDEVLSSRTIWTCAACYSCAVRCPRDIDITGIMLRLRNLAVMRNYPVPTTVGRRGRVYNVDFMRIIRRMGRMYEAELVLRYHLKTNPFNLMKMAPVGLTMFLKRKLRLLPEPAHDRAEIKGIFEHIEQSQRQAADKGREA